MNAEAKGERDGDAKRARKPRKRRRLLWFILALPAAVVVVGLIGYWYISSESFLRSFVLPRVEKATGRKIDLGSADLRPFRGVVLDDLTVGPIGGESEPLFQSEQLVVKWRFRPLLSRRLHVTYLGAHNMRIAAVQAPAAERAAAGKPAAPKPAKPKKPGKKASPWEFRIDEVSVTSSAITLTRPAADPTSPPARYTLRNLEIKGTQLGLGQPAQLDLQARVEADAPAEGTRISDGRVALAIHSKVQPKKDAYRLDGGWSVERLKGQFRGFEAADLLATGVLAVEQQNRDRLVIRRADTALFYKGAPGADVSASGEVNPRTMDGSLTVKVRGVNRAFLNLLSTPNHPLDFADTRAEAFLQIDRAERGKRVALNGDFQLANFSVVTKTVAPGSVPPSQATLRYKAAYEPDRELLTIEELNARVDRQDRNLAFVELTSPMRFPLRPGGKIASDSPASLTMKIDRFDLTQVNPFLHTGELQVREGHLSADSTLRVDAGGSVNAKGSLKLAGLRATAGTRDLGRTDSDAIYDLTFDSERFAIRQLDFHAFKDGKEAGRIQGTGEIAFDGQEGRVVLTGKGIDLSTLQFLLDDVGGVQFSKGVVNFQQTLSAAGKKQPMQFTGQLDADALAFALPDRPRARFANWQFRAENNLAIDPAGETLQIAKLAVTAGETGGGSIGATASGRIGFKKGTGAVDLSIDEAAAPLLASVLDRFGDKPESALKATSGRISGKARLSFEKNLSELTAKGGLKTDGLKWRMKQDGAPAEMAGDLESAFEVALLSKPRRLLIRDTTLKVAGREKAGGSLRVDGKMDLAKTAGELDLEFKQFDSVPVLSIAGPLLGDWRVMGGTVNGRQKIGLGAKLASITAGGRLRVDSLALVPPKASQPVRPASFDLENEVTLTGPGEVIELKRCRLRTLAGQKETGFLDVNGRIDLKKQTTALTVRAERFESAPVWPVLKALGTDVPLAAATLSGTQSVNYSIADSALEAKGALRVDGISIRREDAKPIPLERFDLDADISLKKDKTDVRKLVLSSYSGGQMLDRIELTASGGGMRSSDTMNVTLKAPNLHLDHYLAMLPQSARGQSPGSASRRAPGAAPGKAQASQGFKIPGPPINATVDVGEFHFDRYRAEDIDARLGVTAEGVTIYGMTAKLADGPATATGWLRTDAPKPAFDATISGSGLDVTALLTMFAPGVKDSLSGTGSTRFRVTGMGFNTAGINQSLKCNGALRIENGRWKETPILKSLASVTQVQSLSDIRFFRLDGQLRIERGVVHVDDASLIGQLQKLRAKGTVGFDSSVDLMFDLWLGGELAERLRDKKYFKYLRVENDQYLRLPIPIGMAGTLSKPRPSLKLPTDAILDIGIDQGLRALDEYLKKRRD